MTIKNLKTNLQNFSKNSKYKLCTGIIILGVLTTGIYASTLNKESPKEEPSKSISEMTYEEKDEMFAMLQTNFKNTEHLDKDGDMIGFLKNHKSLSGGVLIEPGREVDTIALTPGEYNVSSETGATTTFTVDNIDQNFVLEIDYASGTMEVKEVEDIKKR